jgi:hypothetical protein
MALAASAIRCVVASITSCTISPVSSDASDASDASDTSEVMNPADWMPSAWFASTNRRSVRSYSAKAAAGSPSTAASSPAST